MGTMKDCESIRPHLSEYVDGVLDENRMWEIKMHLSTCGVCAKVAADFSATARLLAEMPRVEPSMNFEAVLARRLADEVLKSQRKPAWVQWKEKFVDWWQMPGVRPAFATGAAVAVMLPAMFFAFVPTSTRPLVVSASPTAAATPNPDSETLRELWQEHDAYASSVSLGDRSSLVDSEESLASL